MVSWFRFSYFFCAIFCFFVNVLAVLMNLFLISKLWFVVDVRVSVVYERVTHGFFCIFLEFCRELIANG